jgi:hypothetical protein
MTDKLHDYAEATTPQSVHVPNSWPGLAAWATGKFGSAILWAGVACYGLWIVYTDLKSLNDKVLTAFIQQTETNSQLVSTVNELSRSIEAYNTELHRRNTQQP